jgi:endo-1,4-beta-xylanase
MPGFAGVTFWGVNDTHSWIHREFGKDAPLLFDGDYAPKPAYFGARDALAAGRKATARSGPSVQPEEEPDQK